MSALQHQDEPKEGVLGAPPCRIAALTGEQSDASRDAMWRFAERLARQGLRIAGVLERREPGAGRTAASTRLVNLMTGETYPLFQDLGAMATGCRLDTAGLTLACHGVMGTLDASVDLVILNKFGKCEAGRGGLLDAFARAAELDIPILTAVAPSMDRDWAMFADTLATALEPDSAAIEDWWSALQAGALTR